MSTTNCVADCMNPKNIKPITEILDPESLAALMAGYAANPGALADAPLQKYDTLYPPGTPFYKLNVDTFYTHGAPPGTPPVSRLPEQWREIAIVALFTVQQQTLTLAVHIYWALMLGLTVEQVGEIMLLMNAYGGIACYSLGLSTAQQTLCVLQCSAKAGITEPMAVFQELVKAFS